MVWWCVVNILASEAIWRFCFQIFWNILFDSLTHSLTGVSSQNMFNQQMDIVWCRYSCWERKKNKYEEYPKTFISTNAIKHINILIGKCCSKKKAHISTLTHSQNKSILLNPFFMLFFVNRRWNHSLLSRSPNFFVYLKWQNLYLKQNLFDLYFLPVHRKQQQPQSMNERTYEWMNTTRMTNKRNECIKYVHFCR